MLQGRSRFFVVAAIFATLKLAGQMTTGTILGRVADQSGAVVPNTKITLVNAGTNDARAVTVSETGDFTFPQLPPGQYNLTAEHEGFRKDIHNGIILEVGQQARVDVSLQVGAVSEQVEVTASAPLVSTETAALGNVVDNKKVVELPLNGRGYLQLAFLQPSVFQPAQASTIGFRGGMNIAGSNEVSNQYLLDGIDNNEEASNQPTVTPVLDAVQEFRVLTGTYNAEFGRQSGGQIIVTTKSGSNEFHGSAWDFYRNSVFDARNFFALKKLSFIRNQYGAAAGGPVRRNKTFFFAAWEQQNRSGGTSALALVPPVPFRQGNFSALSTQLRNPFNGGAAFAGNIIPQSFWSPQGVGLLNAYPLPNLASTQNNIASSAKGTYNNDQFSVRFDHHLSDRDQFYAKYEFNDSTEFYPLSNPLCSARSVPGWGCFEQQRTQQASTGWTHVFSPSLVNELRLGWVRYGFLRLQQDYQADYVNALKIGGLPDAGVTPLNNGLPQLTLTGYVTIGGATNLPQGRKNPDWNYIENMTWIKGTHTMKWGVDLVRKHFNSFFTSSGRGAFTFQNTFTGNSVADLLLGLPQSATRNPGSPYHYNTADNLGSYFQDDWKVTPKLTINLGLRWDIDFPVTEKTDKVASWDPRTNLLKDAQGFTWTVNPAGQLVSTAAPSLKGAKMWDTDWTRFAPRVGFAWRPYGGNKTVIRAGFGIFNNHEITGNGITPLMRNIPYRLSTTAGPFSATTVPLPSLANAFAGNPSLTPPGIAQDFVPSYTTEWSFGIQRELFRDTLVEISYVGNESHKLPIAWALNQAFPGTVGSTQSRRPYQPWGSITGGYIDSIGNANFHSLQSRFERRVAKGLSGTVSYVYSKSIDQGGNISTSGANSGNAQDARNLAAERGVSDYDVPHRLVVSTVYDVPVSSQNRLVRGIAGGWQLKAISSIQKGQPFTLYDGTDVAGTGSSNDRPNVIGDWHIDNPSPTRWFNTCTLLANGTRSNCLPGDNPAWQIQPVGTFGNLGRNAMRGPGFWNFDLGVSRQVKLTERINAQFRAEFFNIFNHANFFLPATSVSSSSLGSITQAVDQPNGGAQRQMQFALKFVF
jgi:hypothetical protein